MNHRHILKELGSLVCQCLDLHNLNYGIEDPLKVERCGCKHPRQVYMSLNFTHAVFSCNHHSFLRFSSRFLSDYTWETSTSHCAGAAFDTSFHTNLYRKFFPPARLELRLWYKKKTQNIIAHIKALTTNPAAGDFSCYPWIYQAILAFAACRTLNSENPLRNVGCSMRVGGGPLKKNHLMSKSRII